MIQYIIDEKNEKKAVLLAIEDYNALIERLNELEDLFDIMTADRIVKNDDFLPFVKENYLNEV